MGNSANFNELRNLGGQGFYGSHLQANAITFNANSTHAANPPFSGVFSHHPLRPVSTFVPRQALQQDLENCFNRSKDDDHAEVTTVVVYGLGGAGKTQLMLGYAHQHRHDYSAVFWIEAHSRQRIERDFLSVYRLLYNVRGTCDLTAHEVRLAVKNWFTGRQGRWLWVFDNADEIEIESNAEEDDAVDNLS